MEKFRHLDGSEAVVEKEHFTIQFQHGNPADVGMNGCKIEDVILALEDKIADFQNRELACDENDMALRHLALAREALLMRSQRREQQGLLGVRKAHQSADKTAVASS